MVNEPESGLLEDLLQYPAVSAVVVGHEYQRLASDVSTFTHPALVSIPLALATIPLRAGEIILACCDIAVVHLRTNVKEKARPRD